MKSQRAEGFNCSTCDKWHEFGIYVAAHWDIVLTHTCTCGAKHRILQGHATQIRKGKLTTSNSGAKQ